jgi:hypothetical protein
MIEFKKTNRGFLIGEFKDRYGAECSIQESSLATEACLWLGREKDQNGESLTFGRMHLTQDMARELIPVLRHFARTGALGTENPESWVTVGAWVQGLAEDFKGILGRIVSISNGGVMVQDDRTPGEKGVSVTLLDQFDLLWEPAPEPEPRLSAIDALLQDDDDDE